MQPATRPTDPDAAAAFEGFRDALGAFQHHACPNTRDAVLDAHAGFVRAYLPDRPKAQHVERAVFAARIGEAMEDAPRVCHCHLGNAA